MPCRNLVMFSEWINLSLVKINCGLDLFKTKQNGDNMVFEIYGLVKNIISIALFKYH